MGRLLLFTGDGKGKSTAAFGLAVRGLGHGQKVCVIQFIKSEDFITGELLFFRRMGIEIYPCGSGLTWQNGEEENREGIKKAYELAAKKLRDPSYGLIILDEINNVFSINAFETGDICPPDELLRHIERAKENKNIVMTGRNAPSYLMAAADLVTEMKAVKHYYDEGAPAKEGLEY